MGRELLFRVDSRLVHGQVCTAWIPQLGVKRVVIIHDEYAKDNFLVELHRSVVPRTCVCDTITAEAAMQEWNENQFGEENTIVLFQDVATASKLLQMGLPIGELQIATLAGTRQSVSVYKQVNVTREDALLMLDLISKGVSPYCQMYPQDVKVPMKELLSNKRTAAKLKLN